MDETYNNDTPERVLHFQSSIHSWYWTGTPKLGWTNQISAIGCLGKSNDYQAAHESVFSQRPVLHLDSINQELD